MKAIIFTPLAKADMRRLDRQVQERVLQALERFAATGAGDSARLKGEPPEFRLRVGDWRVRFRYDAAQNIHVALVRHRSEAYR